MSDILIKARKPGNHWAYDKVFDLTRLTEAYSRCRRMQYFIATPEALEATPTACPTCGKSVEGTDNRGMYSPKHKRYVIQHYICSWETLLNDIFKLADSGRL